ncbi:MAG TPA: hypothetical protein VF719_12740 [Abditibacteriaceae bacterium]
MATDVEARSRGNAGLILGIVALLLVAGAVYFFGMQPRGADNTTIINNPAPSSPSVTIEAPDAPTSTTTTERRTTIVGGATDTSSSSSSSAPSSSAPVSNAPASGSDSP